MYKNFIVHVDSATEPALAACAANLQGKFKVMEKHIWKDAYSKRDFSRKNLESIAKKSKLKIKKFKKDRDGVCKTIIMKEQAQLSAVGTMRTPAFYINGRFLSGARPIDQFRTLIDEELKKASERIARGQATPENYYKTFVISKGLTKLEAN